jgi:hypothetical protein
MIDDRSAFGIVVGEPARAKDDRQPAVRVFLDPDNPAWSDSKPGRSRARKSGQITS